MIIPAMLERTGPSIRAEMDRRLQSLRPWRYLGEPAATYPSRAGRMLRPTLLMAVSTAFGGDPDDGLVSAVSLELLHNAFLVHDDVEDESELRRGKPALHIQHGVPLAINAGDALFGLATRTLLENQRTLGPRLALRVLHETERTTRSTVQGQAIELGWRQANTLPAEDAGYLDMVLRKTCAYTIIHPLRVGALIGSRGRVKPLRLQQLERFGFLVGAAFQIQDDLLNLHGDPDAYGKELSGDLWEGKRTIMLIDFARRASAEERARVLSLLSTPRDQRREEDVAWLLERIETLGCHEYARKLAHGLAGAAQTELETVFNDLPDSESKAFVSELCTWVISRAE